MCLQSLCLRIGCFYLTVWCNKYGRIKGNNRRRELPGSDQLAETNDRMLGKIVAVPRLILEITFCFALLWPTLSTIEDFLEVPRLLV